MTFLAPDRLWLLLALAALVAVYVVQALRRSRYVVRFTELDLLPASPRSARAGAATCPLPCCCCPWSR